MTNASQIWKFGRRHLWLSGCLVVLLPLGAAGAPPPAPAPRPQRAVIQPTRSNLQFQQTVRQQQVRSQLQQGQLQQQLHQNVSDTMRRPLRNNPKERKQLDQGDRARQDRERAQQQDLLNRYREAAPLPRVVPEKRTPAPARSSSGH